MKGDERARFCGQCRKHVFNFSAMTSAEVEALVQQKEGRLCGRYFQRADGRMLTADCPTGVARRRNRAARWAGSLFATVLFLFGARVSLRSQETNKVNGGSSSKTTEPLMGDIMVPVANTNAPREILGKIAPCPVPPSTNRPPVMGLIAPMPPASTNAPRAFMGRIVYNPVPEKNPCEKAK